MPGIEGLRCTVLVLSMKHTNTLLLLSKIFLSFAFLHSFLLIIFHCSDASLINQRSGSQILVASQSPAELEKLQIAGPDPQNFWFGRAVGGLKTCISPSWCCYCRCSGDFDNHPSSLVIFKHRLTWGAFKKNTVSQVHCRPIKPGSLEMGACINFLGLLEQVTANQVA